MTFGAVVLSWTAAFAFLAAPENESAQSLRSRFEKEAPTSWARLESELDGVQGTFTVHSMTLVSGHPVKRARVFHFAIQGSLKKFEDHLVNDSGTTSVACANDGYAFELGKNKADRQLRVTKYDNTPSQQAVQGLLEHYRRHVQAALSFGDVSLPAAWTAGPSRYRLTDVSRVRYQERDMVRVDFEGPPYHARPGDVPVRYKRWAILDPAQGWIAYEIHRLRDFGESVQINEFAFQNGLPYPRRILEQDFDKAGAIFGRNEFTFKALRPFADSKAAFTLTAYGLPEVRDRSRPFGIGSPALWLLLNGAFLLAAGVGIYLWKRRNSASAGPPGAGTSLSS